MSAEETTVEAGVQLPGRLDLRSEDVAADRRAELLRLFPEVAIEGGRVDFEQLKRALGEQMDSGKERYGMTWPGKADCFRAIQTPSTGTLLPAPEESVRFDTTENLYIEGDSLEVLKLLQKSYLGKVKMIYIDPPYNTGNDFIYPDNYTESLQTYLEYTGQADAEGRKFSTNTDTSGRFHSNWLNMMYPRLYLARNLLRSDGVIFISIDDHEVGHLRSLCDEVFGEENFVATLIWNNEGNIDNQSKFKTNHEYIHMYARSLEHIDRPTVIDPNVDETSKLFRDEIENSITKNGPANPPSKVLLPAGFPATFASGVVEKRSGAYPLVHDDINVEDSVLVNPAVVESGWSSKNLLQLFIDNGFQPISDALGKRTRFALTPTGAIYGYKERSEDQGHVLTVIRNVGTTKQNSSMLAKWGLEFDWPKPVRLIEYLCQIATKNDDTVLDFFAGSATTAQAVLDANRRDGHRRHFVMIQLPEPLKEPRKLKNGRTLKTISDMAVERIRCASAEIAAAPRIGKSKPELEDLGFRVFKLGESNFTTWDAQGSDDPAALEQRLELHVEHIRGGRSDSDLLHEILLKSGFPLATPVETMELVGKRVFSVADGALLLCLDRKLNLELIRAIAEKNPERVVCLDSGFAGNDQLKANAVQLFKTKGIASFKTV
jgi:adenine-specific DNA-methyltransferase